MAVNHVWKKYNIHKIYKNITKYRVERSLADHNCYLRRGRKYPKSYTIDEDTGYVTFSNYDIGGQVIYSGCYVDYYNSEEAPGSGSRKFYEIDNFNLGSQNITSKTVYLCEVKSYQESVLSHKEKGDYIEDIKSPDINAYPDNGEKNGYWYVYKGIDNQKPTVDGYNNDLGNKTDDFTVDYVITDSDNDTCTVDILVDGIKKVSSKAVTLGYRHSYNVNINDFTIGSHNIEIIAKDSKESTSETRRYTFYKPNIAPVINGEDADLGGKSSAFTVDYHVSDRSNDSVNVNVLLDDLEIASVSSAQNQELQLKVTDEMLNNFEIGSNHTITIKADDLKGGISYRRYTFTKTNKPPVISGSDQNLGNKTEPFNVSWSITDLERNPITFKVYLDDKLVMQEDTVVDNKTYSYSIPHDEWIKLNYTNHEIRVVASDEFNINNPVTRKFTFNRMSDGLDVEVKINEFTDKPNKIIAIPHFGGKGDDTVHVYACNNYLDEQPTWEDMTTESNAGRAHAFTNESKTSEKWAIGVKVTIEQSRNVNSPLVYWGSILKGIKGGYE